MNTRSRNFCLVLYCTEEELLRKLITYKSRIDKYAYILHDKDIYDSDLFDKDGNLVHSAGELEKEHRQMVIRFYDACTVSAVRKLFKTDLDNAQVQPCDLVAMYRYLTHRDNPEKYQYNESDIESNDIEYFRSLELRGMRKDSDMTAQRIVEDILAKVPPRLLLMRYGREYVIHRVAYEDCAFNIYRYELENSVQRKLDLTYKQMHIREEEDPFAGGDEDD